ncbi:hypothetical protein NQZ68_023156 [Dissostichus eleginoides]|nr:hypothetical protein NQZ68_023156 [Dissostichus eleginoides]
MEKAPRASQPTNMAPKFASFPIWCRLIHTPDRLCLMTSGDLMESHSPYGRRKSDMGQECCRWCRLYTNYCSALFKTRQEMED